MAPFPEAEDMTIKRLYVALKRDDMQLLQMGAHKLHEKFHTGHKFELLDDLKQILSYVEEQTIPNDIKDLLTKTINDILTGEAPDASYYPDETKEDIVVTVENKVPESEVQNISSPASSTSSVQLQLETPQSETVYSEQSPEISPAENITAQTVEDTKQKEIDGALKTEEVIEPVYVLNPVNHDAPAEPDIEEPEPEAAFDNSDEVFAQPKEEPVIFTPENAAVNMVNSITESPFIAPKADEPPQAHAGVKILEEKISTLENVAVFYDDKAPFIDFTANKKYRTEFNLAGFDKEENLLNSAAIVKNAVDIQTDEFGEIIKMLNTIKGEVYFVTTSKSENILKTFEEYNVNFEIPDVITKEVSGKRIKLIPLFGLSNIFSCPKCGRKEAVVFAENKILSIGCNNCASAMYPDICEASNLESNANPYYFIKGINSMANADTWILINPPLEGSRALTSAFIRTEFEVVKPKKVCILSKETTKKEYYRQMFKEIDENIDVKADFITQDSLCEEFINSEMSTIRVNA